MFDFIVQTFEGIFTIVFVVGIGYYLSYKKWFDDRSSKLIARLVTSVSLPLYMITSLKKNFTLEKLLALAPDMLLPICSIVLAMIIGFIVAKFFYVAKGRRGIFITNFFIANTMFIGLPVNLALFGDESIPSVMLYYIVNLVFFWTLGVHFIISDSSDESKGGFSLNILKKLWTPPLIGFIVAIFMIILDLNLPRFLMKGFQYVGNLTTPLSLIFIGIEISRLKWSDLHLERDLLGGVIGRFIVCPLSVLFLAPLIATADISLKVFAMQAAMPAMTQMAIVAKEYGADSSFAATLSFVTILGGLLVIPIYMTIINVFF